MANGQVQDQISNSYLQTFDRPLSVSAVDKLRQFPFLQELGYNGQLGHLKDNFHGLKEFNVQMDMYSQHPLLKAAWTIIKYIAPKNPFITAKLFISSTMGSVGNLFQGLQGFDKVFSLSPDELKDPTQIAAKALNV